MTHPLFAAVLSLPSTPTATNFYRDDSDAVGSFQTTAAERRAALDAHLVRVEAGDLVLIGEAAGWRGARQSGVAFTSARQLGKPGSSEGSATIVHDELTKLGIADRTLLWNTFPPHPHSLHKPSTNRTPTTAERASTAGLLIEAARGRYVVCVGRIAADAYGDVVGATVPNIGQATATDAVVAVRHPANGGSPLFRAGLQAATRLWRLV